MADKDMARVFQLRCAYQTFIWGKRGHASLVAELLKSTDDTLKIDKDTAYAEMWMGTHCLGSSSILRADGTEEDLDKWIAKNPDAVSVQHGTRCDGNLPFMFKVLSIRKTLSLQVHPDKSLATGLHAKYPDIYKDGNHKPEMAIAINNFRALVGFKPANELAQHLKDVEELRDIVGTDNAETFIRVASLSDAIEHKDVLQSCFEEAFFSVSKRKLDLLDKLVARVQLMLNVGEDVSRYEGLNLLKIAKEYPRDIGPLAVYFLNEVVLKPNEALFIDVNEPHAYLEGDCMECLTCSHNIGRFGLTHKIRDFASLKKMLKYNSTQPADVTIHPSSYEENGCNMLQYLPSINEFAVSRIEVSIGLQETTINSMQSASILLCMEGVCQLRNKTIQHSITLQRGMVVFVSAGETIAISKEHGTVVIFRAFYSL